jgi:Flp pilus assembly protein TadD
VELAARTDGPSLQGDTYCDLGAVLAQARRKAEAREAFNRAVILFAGKGDVVSADRVRGLLGGLS